jgi:hypothetical protein
VAFNLFHQVAQPSIPTLREHLPPYQDHRRSQTSAGLK